MTYFPAQVSDDTNENTSEEERLQLDCVLAIQGVNWPVTVPITTPWSKFLLTIARELSMEIEEIRLSYQFSSFSAADKPEVLYTRDHYQNMITKAKDFLTGKKKVCGGKDFHVHLEPVIKHRPQTPVAEGGLSKKGTKKVSYTSTYVV